MRDSSPSRTPKPVWTAALLVAASLLSIATQAPQYQYPRSFPVWTMTDANHQLGCAKVVVWISKSGKTGVGVSVHTSTTKPQCQVDVDAIKLEIAGKVFVGQPLVSAPPLIPDESIHFYSPIEFDNEALWNRGDRDAVIVVAIVVDGVRSPLRVATNQNRKGSHDKISRGHSPALGPLAVTTVGPDGILRAKPAAKKSGGPLAPVTTP